MSPSTGAASILKLWPCYSISLLSQMGEDDSTEDDTGEQNVHGARALTYWTYWVDGTLQQTRPCRPYYSTCYYSCIPRETSLQAHQRTQKPGMSPHNNCPC